MPSAAPGATGQGAVGPSQPIVAAVEAADLYRIPLWALMKIFYRVAPISLLFRLATLRGTLEWRRSPTREETVRRIERHLGGQRSEARAIARRNFEFRSRAFFGRLWPQIRGFAAAESVEIDGLHHLDQALAGGKGAILVSAHFGHARLIKPLLASRGRQALLVARLLPPGRPLSRAGSFVHDRVLSLPRWSRFSTACHETMGSDLRAGLNVRPLVAALRRNETLIILMDGRRSAGLRGMRVLGLEIFLAPGAVSIAHATQAPILPIFAVDDPEARSPGAVQLTIHPPLELDATGDVESDMEANLWRFAAALEHEARRHPHNWYWSAVEGELFVPELAQY